MMKVKISRKAAAAIIINIILMGLLTVQYFQIHGFKDSFNMVGVRFRDKVINTDDLESILENDENASYIKYVLWNEDKNKEITTNETGGSITADVVTIGGDFSAAPLSLKSGMGFSDDDYEGCILDKESAWDLWKSYDVIGNTVVIDENIYYVRGIAKKIDGAKAIYIRDRNKDALYTYADFKYTDSKGSAVIDDYEQKTKEILGSFGAYDAAIIDGIGLSSLLSTAGSLANIIAVLLICAFNGTILCCSIYSKSNGLKSRTLIFLLMAGLFIIAIGAVFIVGGGFMISVKYIPDKWSDFEFIKNCVDGIKESFENIRHISYIKYDAMLQGRFEGGLYFNLIVFVTEFIYSIFYIWYISNRRHKV